MNIIQLFSLLDLKRDEILKLDSEDYIRIEKKINFEKKINPEIDSRTSENLILALKEYKEELLFVLSNRILFNFLNQSNFSKNNFSDYDLTVSDEKIKNFISLFLADDLVSFFGLKLSKNKYNTLEELSDLLNFKGYFPEEILHKMALLVFSKVDFVNSQLVSSENVNSNIYYIEFNPFYDLLSHFSGIEMDQKVANLLSVVFKFYKRNKNVLFFNSVLRSMASYTAFNENLHELLIKNREAVSKTGQGIEAEINHPAMGIALAVICALIPFIVTKCS